MIRVILAVAMGLLLSACGANVPSTANPAPSPEHQIQALSDAPESVLFREGNGGDLAWWEAHGAQARNDDEKTAAAFVLAVLKRDIGANANRPAGIDAFIEPSKLADVKTSLAIYDISSPSVRNIHFVGLSKDDTGTCFTFKVTGGTSADAFQGFEGTLQFHVQASNHLVDRVLKATFDAKPSSRSK